MRPELELYELIDRYLGNQLSAAEKSAFEIRMNQDAELKEAVQMADITRELIVEHSLQKEKAFLKQLEAEYRNPPTNWKIISGIVAGVILSAAAYLLWPKAEVANESEIRKENIVSVKKPVAEVSPEINTTNATKKIAVKTEARPKASEPTQTNTSEVKKEAQELVPVTSENKTEAKQENTVPKEEPKEKIEVKEVAKVSCAVQLGGVTFETTPSCKKEPTGTLEVKGAGRGISLFLDEEQVSSRTGGLSSGKHILVVKNQECMISHTVAIGSVACISNKTLSWSLSDQHQWTIELAQEEGRLILMDKGGRILKDETVRGNSYSVPSETLTAVGVYQFRITYPDGETEQGYIQVVP